MTPISKRHRAHQNMLAAHRVAKQVKNVSHFAGINSFLQPKTLNQLPSTLQLT